MRYRRRGRVDGGAVLVGLAVLVAAAVIARNGTVPPWERSVFHAVNDLPDWLYWPMWLLQVLGVLVTPLVLAVVALAFRQWRLAGVLVALVPLKLFVERQVIKELITRERPAAAICGGDTGCGSFRGDAPLAGASFPSGHAVVAGALAWVLAPYLGTRGRVVVFSLAASVCVSRVYLGAHNPLDVVAGFAVGTAIGALLNLVAGVPAHPPAAR